MKYLFSLILILFALTGLRAQPAPAEKLYFRGTLAGQEIEMTLERTGVNLKGSYFDVDAGRATALKLTGTIDARGKIILRVFGAHGRLSATWQGAFSEDPQLDEWDFNGDRRKTGAKKSQAFYTTREMIYLPEECRIETVSHHEAHRRNPFEIGIEYPQLVCRSDENEDFNHLAQTGPIEAMFKFKREMMERSPEEIKNSEGRDALSIQYSVKYADENWLSLQYFSSESSFQMIHPLAGSRSLNYDLKNRRRAEPGDLFKPGSKYLELISALCLKELRSRPPVNGQNLAAGDWANGAGPDAENFVDWNLTDQGLLITFGFYQIAAYPAGENCVLIPYSKLAAEAAPGGILEKMLKRQK